MIPFIIFFMVDWALTTPNIEFDPCTLINVTVFVEHVGEKLHLHAFFLRGELSMSKRSFQYFLLDKLKFTHVKFETPKKDFNPTKVEQYKDIFKAAMKQKGVAMQLNTLAKYKIQPFVFELENKNVTQTERVVALRNLEEMAALHVFQNYSSSTSSFYLYHNKVEKQDGILKSLPEPVSTNQRLEIFLQIEHTKSTNNGTETHSFKPFKFAFLQDDSSIFDESAGNVISFNLAKYGDNWSIVSEQTSSTEESDVHFEDLKAHDSKLEIIGYFDLIFDSVKQATTYTITPKTYFMQSFVSKEIKEALQYDANGIALLEKILYGKTELKTVWFDDIPEEAYDETGLSEGYSVAGELFPSFSEEVLYSDSPPLNEVVKEEETDTSSSSISESSSSSTKSVRTHSSSDTTSKSLTSSSESSTGKQNKEMSGGTIGVIAAFSIVLLIGIGFVVWYFTANKKTNKKFRRPTKH